MYSIIESSSSLPLFGFSQNCDRRNRKLSFTSSSFPPTFAKKSIS